MSVKPVVLPTSRKSGLRNARNGARSIRVVTWRLQAMPFLLSQK